MLTLDAFRARFPLLGRKVYVNTCSQGALSSDVEAALAAFVESWHADGSPWDRWVDEVERLRALVAASIGADADEIAVMPSASAAITSVATSLRFDAPRSRVVLGELEFPTLAHVWLAQQPRGAVVDWVAADPSATADPDPGSTPSAAEEDAGTSVRADADTVSGERYAARIDDRTRVVAATHVSYRTGLKLDIARLAAMARERGALFLLDDYQRTGTAPFDVRRAGVDFMVTGALKYLLGPAGVAFLYVRRDLIHALEPLATGWFGRVDPFAFSARGLDWAPSARRFEAGTPPVPNVYAAAAGLELLTRVGAAAIADRIDHLVDRFATGARARGFRLATPAEPARRGPLVVVRASDGAAVVARLAAQGIVASARGSGLRVSFHAYNANEDVDAVLAALDACRPLLSA